MKINLRKSIKRFSHCEYFMKKKDDDDDPTTKE